MLKRPGKILDKIKEQVMEEEAPEQILEKPRTVNEAVNFIKDITTDSKRYTENELENMANLQNRASAGEPAAAKELTELIKNILEQYEVEIDGYSSEELAAEIYKKAWGLDVIHDLFYSPDIYEVYVDRPNMVSASRRGKFEILENIKFENNEHVDNLVAKMISHAEDKHFDSSKPSVLCVRKDGSRLTALRPPLSEYTTFSLRKLIAEKIDKNYLIEVGSVNEQVFNIIVNLARYGARILFIGPPESGKSSWIRMLVGELDRLVRTISIEAEKELFLSYYYPDRSNVELEEHSHLKGGSLEELFAINLRLASSLLIFGEFRVEEIGAAVMAGERARHFWSTSHFRNAQEAVSGMADLLLKQNPSLTHDVAERQSLRAFNTFITLYGDMKTGNKKVLDITIAENEGDEVEYRNLVRWNGSKDNYWIGDWSFPDKPSNDFINEMRLYNITDQELEKVGWL